MTKSPSHQVTKSPVIKDILLCIVAGGLLSAAFSSFNLWIFAWFGFIPLLYALQDKSARRGFLLAYLTGVVFWAFTVYWLVHVTLLGTIILILYLSLYFGIFGLLITNYRLLFTNYQFLTIPALWVLLEYLRSYLMTGFPWALLGYSQYTVLPAIQIADLFGVWGVSFLVMMFNVALYRLIRRDKNSFLITILILFLVLGYGFLRLPITNYHLPLTVKISIIQANIPQELKWDPGAREFIVQKYIELTKEASQDNPDLIIWPEAASPDLVGADRQALKEALILTRELKIPLLTGAVRREDEPYFNSALLLDDGKVITRYDKLHLVPFGEYIPLKKAFPFLQVVVPIGDISPGKEYTLFSVRQLATGKESKFGTLICFEDLFPELSREFVKKGAGFLVTITNDAWYKETSAAFQHLQASVFRAVENRVCMARAANTGVSVFILPTGLISAYVEDGAGKRIFVRGLKTGEVFTGRAAETVYSRFPFAFIFFCIIFFFCSIISPLAKKK